MLSLNIWYLHCLLFCLGVPQAESAGSHALIWPAYHPCICHIPLKGKSLTTKSYRPKYFQSDNWRSKIGFIYKYSTCYNFSRLWKSIKWLQFYEKKLATNSCVTSFKQELRLSSLRPVLSSLFWSDLGADCASRLGLFTVSSGTAPFLADQQINYLGFCWKSQVFFLKGMFAFFDL